MPQCGGEHVFSYRAMGPTGSFVCTWMIILGYVATAAFEATALPTVITYLFPKFNQVYLYTIAGKDIYLTTILLGVGVAILITLINIKGAKTAAVLQTILTAIIAIAGILLVVGSAINGDSGNVTGQMWQASTGNTLGSVFKVACMTPFLFIGFDVIPQAAEEINVPYKKIGKIMLLSIFGSCLVSAYHFCCVLYHAGQCHCKGDGFTEWACFCQSDRDRISYTTHGQGSHYWWSVRYHYFLEFILDGWKPCAVFHG